MYRLRTDVVCICLRWRHFPQVYTEPSQMICCPWLCRVVSVGFDSMRQWFVAGESVLVFYAFCFHTESHKTTGVCKYWARGAGVLEIHVLIHKHPLSTYYVLAIVVLAGSQTDVPAFMNLRGSSKGHSSSPYYTMPVKIFASLSYAIIIRCFLGNLVSILETRRLRQCEVRKPSPRITKLLSGGTRI